MAKHKRVVKEKKSRMRPFRCPHPKDNGERALCSDCQTRLLKGMAQAFKAFTPLGVIFGVIDALKDGMERIRIENDFDAADHVDGLS